MTKITRQKDGHKWEAEYFSFSQPVQVTHHHRERGDHLDWALGYATVLDDEEPGLEFLLEGGIWVSSDHCYLEDLS